MTYDPRGGGAPDYCPCRYGASRLIFRGPKRRPDGRHVAVLGGTETYGKFIETPWPDLLEQLVGRQVVNLGQMNAGVDVFAGDKTVMDLCHKARVTVVELTGAQNLTNRYYAVHPRRNDRFLRASALLRSRCPEMDFTEFNFTGHLLSALRDRAPDVFAELVADLRAAWAKRMRALIAGIDGPVVVLWLSDRRADRPADDPLAGSGPLFVDAAMVDALRPQVASVVEIVADAAERAEGYQNLLFDDMDAPAAAQMLGPVVHRRAAQRLAEAIKAL